MVYKRQIWVHVCHFKKKLYLPRWGIKCGRDRFNQMTFEPKKWAASISDGNWQYFQLIIYSCLKRWRKCVFVFLKKGDTNEKKIYLLSKLKRMHKLRTKTIGKNLIENKGLCTSFSSIPSDRDFFQRRYNSKEHWFYNLSNCFFGVWMHTGTTKEPNLGNCTRKDICLNKLWYLFQGLLEVKANKQSNFSSTEKYKEFLE